MCNFWLSLSVRLWLSLIRWQKRVSVFLVSVISTTPLFAQANDGLFGMLDGFGDDAKNSAKSLLNISFFVGIFLVMVGVGLWVAKKKNPQISWLWVITSVAAGLVFIALDQFIKKGQSTIKLNPVDVG